MTEAALYQPTVDGLSVILVHISMVPSGWILMTLMILWLFLQHHHEVHIWGFEWNISTAIGQIAVTIGPGFLLPLKMRERFKLCSGGSGRSQNKLRSFMYVSDHTWHNRWFIKNERHVNRLDIKQVLVHDCELDWARARSLALPWIHIQGTMAHNDQTGQSFSRISTKIRSKCLNADEENVILLRYYRLICISLISTTQ